MSSDTLNITCTTFAPTNNEASITPQSTSFNEDSIILATNGAAAMDKGTIVAVEPIVVPFLLLFLVKFLR